MEVEQQPTGVPDGWEIVSAPAHAAPPTSDARPSVSARAGVPAAGRGSQINPDQSMRGLELATTPLAHPTGIDAIDGMTSPVGIASMAAGGVGVARAGLSGGIMAAARAAAGEASPILKYEAARRVALVPLHALGLPGADALASTIAMMVSGYKKGAKGEAPVSSVPPAGVETAQDALARKMASAPTAAPPVVPAESVPAPQGPPLAAPAPPVGSSARSVAPPPMPGPTPSALPPAPRVQNVDVGPDGLLVGRPGLNPNEPLVGRPGGNPAMPDQRALNEAALARRRAAAQATPPTPAKPMLLASEAKAYMQLLNSGKTAKEAMEAIVAMRSLGAMTDAERIAAQDARYLRGEVKTPSAETARARRGAQE